MPSYDYKCPNGHSYTETRSIYLDQQVTECPECGEELKRDWESENSAVIFNGTGFYSIDSKTELLKNGQTVDW